LPAQEQDIKKETVTEWVNQYSDALYSWVLYKTSSQEMAEDIIQDTFLAAVKAYDGFKGDSSPKTWLYSIANRIIIDYYRKKTKTNFVSLENDLMQNNFDNGTWKHSEGTGFIEETALLDNPNFLNIYEICLDNLPLKWKGVIASKYIDIKDNEFICQEYDITLSNLWQIVHRAKLQLKNCLNKNWKDE
jgi:RNA polymerase sigma-70 factor (ECF subfamily)